MTHEFCHLHVHTDASKIDGLGTVDRLVNAAAKFGFTSLAMTDHGSLANTISFIQACNTAGIKPIIGIEGYIEIEKKVGHITLLADGNEGFNSLVQLNNIGQRSEFTKPAFNIDQLIYYNKGLLCLTGCPASPMQNLDYPDAKNIALKLKDAFGSRLFAEAMFVSENPYWERAAQLAKDVKIPIVTTNDVHFPFEEDAPIHHILTQLKAGFTYESRFLFLATPAQIEKRIADRGHVEALPIAKTGFKNSFIIAQKIKPATFSGTPSLPEIDDADASLKKLLKKSLHDYSAKMSFGGTPIDEPTYNDRMEYEYETIVGMGFSTYFLILRDIVQYALNNDIRVGPGRGSAAGSLVSFLLNITEIDPIKYGLSFERFLNPMRKGMPDIDVDFDSEGRHAVIQYAIKKWGGYPVATYSRYSHKMLVHDLAKFFRMPRDVEVSAADEGVESEAFSKLEKADRLFRPTYEAMMGQIRHVGKHAGGVIITDAPVPLERASGEGELVAGWTEGENKELTEAGIVKYDILGLSALSILKILEEKHGRRAPEPEDGAPEFELFRTGDLIGIFQFSGSDGIVEYTKSVSPNSLDDLVAINALYRPGALDAGTARHYPEWRKTPRSLHPLVDSILQETAGIIVYQEQVMEIYATLTSGNLADADLARRTISKTKPGDPAWEIQMAELKSRMISGATSKGMDPETAEKIWREIATHSRYSFNRSHSVAYARVAWDMAWWKWNYRADFYAALLTVDTSEAQRYIFDVVSSGIEVVPPHVNHSSKNYESDGTKIYMPLSVVKYLGEKGVDEIIEHRPYSSMEDFVTRVAKRNVTSRSRLGLHELGAFSDLPGSYRDLGITSPVSMSVMEKQQAYMGFVIPEMGMLSEVAKARKQGFVAGVIYDKVEKESKFGPYVVYYLLPYGTVWSRNTTGLEVGRWVKIKVKKDSGKILSVIDL